LQSLTSLKGSPVSSKLLIPIILHHIGTNAADTQACSQCLHPAMIVFCWQCIQQNQS